MPGKEIVVFKLNKLINKAYEIGDAERLKNFWLLRDYVEQVFSFQFQQERKHEVIEIMESLDYEVPIYKIIIDYFKEVLSISIDKS